MLTTTLLHPEILHALARAGHGSRILIADGNYPVGTTLGKNSALVHLNLRPDTLTVDEILEALLTAIVVEEARRRVEGLQARERRRQHAMMDHGRVTLRERVRRRRPAGASRRFTCPSSNRRTGRAAGAARKRSAARSGGRRRAAKAASSAASPCRKVASRISSRRSSGASCSASRSARTA